MNFHPVHFGMAGTGAGLALSGIFEKLAGAGSWLASLSYLATFLLACVTIYFKIRDRNKHNGH